MLSQEKKWWQPCSASLPHGSDQEEKKKINRQNAGKQEWPLEMNEKGCLQKAHLLYVSSGDFLR